MKIRIGSLILAICMSLCLTVSAVAQTPPALDTDKPNVTISTAAARPGDTVRLTVSLQNNPGVWGMRFYIGYDNANLTVTDRTASNDIFKSIMFSPADKTVETILCENSGALDANTTANGQIAVLTFQISENAQPGFYPVEFVNYDPNDFFDCNFKNVAFTFGSGGITVLPDGETAYGDVNGDGRYTATDSMFIRLIVAELDQPSHNMDYAAADVNGDGRYTAADTMYIRRLVAELITADQLPVNQ